MIQMNEYLISSNIKVKFELTDSEHVHYRYARGLITEQEAQELLSASLDVHTLRKMERLISHLSIY